MKRQFANLIKSCKHPEVACAKDGSTRGPVVQKVNSAIHQTVIFSTAAEKCNDTRNIKLARDEK